MKTVGKWVGALARALGIAATFATVSIGWILFRAQSLADAWLIMNKVMLELVTRLDNPLLELQGPLTLCYVYLSPVDLPASDG